MLSRPRLKRRRRLKLCTLVNLQRKGLQGQTVHLPAPLPQRQLPQLCLRRARGRGSLREASTGTISPRRIPTLKAATAPHNSESTTLKTTPTSAKATPAPLLYNNNNSDLPHNSSHLSNLNSPKLPTRLQCLRSTRRQLRNRYHHSLKYPNKSRRRAKYQPSENHCHWLPMLELASVSASIISISLQFWVRATLERSCSQKPSVPGDFMVSRS